MRLPILFIDRWTSNIPYWYSFGAIGNIDLDKNESWYDIFLLLPVIDDNE